MSNFNNHFKLKLSTDMTSLFSDSISSGGAKKRRRKKSSTRSSRSKTPKSSTRSSRSKTPKSSIGSKLSSSNKVLDTDFGRYKVPMLGVPIEEMGATHMIDKKIITRGRVTCDLSTN